MYIVLIVEFPMSQEVLGVYDNWNGRLVDTFFVFIKIRFNTYRTNPFQLSRTPIIQNVAATTQVSTKRESYYKQLGEGIEKARPENWHEAKPFNEIPGPKGLPLIGNLWRFLPHIGEFHDMDFFTISKKLHQDYGKISTLGKLTGLKIIMLFDVESFETFYRNEGFWPIREGMSSLTYYRKYLRKDVFKDGVSGLSTVQGAEWFDFRSKVNPFLMQPSSIARYTEAMDEVADDFVRNVRKLSKLNEFGEMPEDFLNEIYKWGMESIGVFALDTRLDCLRLDLALDSLQQQLINNLMKMFSLPEHLDYFVSLSRYFPTPTWYEFVKALDFVTDTTCMYIEEAIKGMNDKGHNREESVLEKLVKIDKNVAIAMAIDTLGAGVDTTGRVLGALLYFLAKNPDVQTKLRQELLILLPEKSTKISKQILNNSKYLKAVIKEAMRLAPISIGTLRTTTKDLVLCDYQIPKGTQIVTNNLLQCHSNENFPKASEFRPERFLRNVKKCEWSYKNGNQFVFKPFGYGPRMCIGSRLATLELEVVTAKLVRNFEFSWPHPDMEFKTHFFYGIANPLKLHVKQVN